MAGEIVRVVPKGAPHGKLGIEIGITDAGGEGFEGDDAVVTVVGQGLKQRIEVDSAAAETAAMAFIDVNVAEPIAQLADDPFRRPSSIFM